MSTAVSKRVLCSRKTLIHQRVIKKWHPKPSCQIEHDSQSKTRAEYLTTGRGASWNPEQVVTEGMRAQVNGNTVVVTGVHKEKRVRDGKPYQRRGCFINT
jgi:hypothetical protein